MELRRCLFRSPVLADVRLEEPTGLPSFPHGNLPARPAGMVGRDEDVLKLSARLHADRFVTIVGVGGIGQTTVAIAVGHHLADTIAGAVLGRTGVVWGNREVVRVNSGGRR